MKLRAFVRKLLKYEAKHGNIEVMIYSYGSGDCAEPQTRISRKGKDVQVILGDPSWAESF